MRRLSLLGLDVQVGRARDFTLQALTEWQWQPSNRFGDEAVEDVLLVVSELVANATAHAAGSTELALLIHHGQLTVSVSDTDPLLPAPRSAEPSRPGGHGLHIVALLAADWGTTTGPHGKTVWAIFHT